MKEIFVIVLVIVGALIGAGFASGQEIYSFFYSYGLHGMFGLVVTCILIGILINKILKIILKYEINNYDQFLSQLIKNKKIIKVVNNILNILLLITFYIMIAGFGAYFEQQIGVHKIIGSLVLAILCFFVFLTSVKGVLKVSEYIVPLLIIFIVIIGIINFNTIDNFQNIETLKNGWLISAITYCSYNIILIIPVLITLRKHIRKTSDIKYISLITTIIMLILSFIIYTILLKSDVDISKLEMPVVYIVSKFFSKFEKIYAFIILSSIFTTAISIGTGFLQNISKNEKSYPQLVIFMCISSLVVSNIGFSKLVNIVYPFFGYIGIIQIMLILSKNICKK